MTKKYIYVLTIWEDHAQLEQAPLPQSLLLARYATLPSLEIKKTLSIALRLGIEPKRVVSSPLFALLVQPVHTQRHGGESRVNVVE
jgi:hypothetical protein